MCYKPMYMYLHKCIHEEVHVRAGWWCMWWLIAFRSIEQLHAIRQIGLTCMREKHTHTRTRTHTHTHTHTHTQNAKNGKWIGNCH